MPDKFDRDLTRLPVQRLRCGAGGTGCAASGPDRLVGFAIENIAASAYWVGASGTFVSNFARLVLKNALTLRTFASAVNSRCDNAR